jgi:hypothetical protein
LLLAVIQYRSKDDATVVLDDLKTKKADGGL